MRIVVPGWDVASSEAALELAAAHADLVVAAVGVHPHDVAGMDDAQWDRLERLAREPGTAAIGEIGLDYHRNLSPPDRQREAFDRQLELAMRCDRPVLVHDREAHEDVRAALLRHAGLRGALHAFSGDREMALDLAAAGFLISFALPLAFRSAEGPRAAASALPDHAFLVETDAPYLGPDPTRRNEPTTALRVAAELARLRGTSPETIAAAAAANLGRLLGPRAPAAPVAPAGTSLANRGNQPSVTRKEDQGAQ